MFVGTALMSLAIVLVHTSSMTSSVREVISILPQQLVIDRRSAWSKTESAILADSGDAELIPLPLTVETLSQMTSFWTSFLKEPLAIRDSARALHQMTMTIGTNVGTIPITAVDMIALSKTYPSVAADFQRVHLTPLQWEQLRLSLVLRKLDR